MRSLRNHVSRDVRRFGAKRELGPLFATVNDSRLLLGAFRVLITHTLTTDITLHLAAFVM